MQKPKKHIIWDWNGTLLNDAFLCVEVMNRILEKRNMPQVTEDYYRNVFDFPVIAYYETLGFDFKKESFELVGTEFISGYNSRQHECHLHQGSVQLLQTLSNKGIGLSVLSARGNEDLQKELLHYKLRPFFTEVRGLDNHYAGGKETIAKQLIHDLPHHPSEVLLIGDTTHDYQVAKTIDVDCILVAQGHQSKKRLTNCEGAVVVDQLPEILSLVL